MSQLHQSDRSISLRRDQSGDLAVYSQGMLDEPNDMINFRLAHCT